MTFRSSRASTPTPVPTITTAPGSPVIPGAGTPYLFLMLRCDRPLEAGARLSLSGVENVNVGRADSLSVERVEEGGGTLLRLGIPDPRMSSCHARLQKVFGTWIVVDAASKNGTWVDGKRVTNTPLADGALFELGHSFLLFREALPGGGSEFLDGSKLRPPAHGFATLSPALSSGFDGLVLVAASRIPVLLRGETGTGKEVIARALHELSGRPGPFVAVDCGALPETLVESQLFGCRKGAFSGASEDRPGLVRASHTGTLLLDEIGNLPLAAQAALLRVIQEEEVLPLGATRPIRVDLRVVAATHGDLEALASEGRFRPDLLARLSGHAFALPPLRKRREDLGLLIASVLRKIAGEAAGSVTFTADAARALLHHAWPLNVRELEKCLTSALVFARGRCVGLEHLPESVRRGPDETPGDSTMPVAPLNELQRQRHEELVGLLREHDGNVTAVARSLGKRRTHVQRWLKRLQIDPLSFRR